MAYGVPLHPLPKSSNADVSRKTPVVFDSSLWQGLNTRPFKKYFSFFESKLHVLISGSSKSLGSEDIKFLILPK